MFKVLIPLAASLAFVATAAAQSGTVTVTGELVAPTCVVDVNGSAGDGTVVLPNVLTSTLAAAGSRSGRTPFMITLGSAATPCLHPNVKVEFVNGGNVNAAGRLNNNGTAGNVQVAMLNSASQEINLSNNTNVLAMAVPASGIAQVLHHAEYYAASATRPGTVVTSVQYNITYP